MEKKFKFELTEQDIVHALRDSCKWQIDRHEIREALVKAICIEIKEYDLEKWLRKASEKSIKDIARWKLLQDFIQCRQEQESMVREFEVMKQSFDKVIEEVHQYKDIMQHLRQQEELLKE